MFRKGEIQSPAQTGCGKLAAFMAVGIVVVIGAAGYGLFNLVA
jgi:hypothetical protein